VPAAQEMSQTGTRRQKAALIVTKQLTREGEIGPA
jgi:hypothetical protein